MIYTHGSLENEILNAVWTMEENDISTKSISVSEVLNEINNNGNVRAYTTVKTVMDRLVDKNLLKRQKSGKKFCYKSVESREKMAETAINKLAGQYFNNDVRSLMRALEKQCISTKT
ncbi:MAG: BlaI/MecI/CopY family transcriptional regulator [Candidatus Gastranaerophilales bacterium]|nr:BlaI/MecI/CopY family transcriptional regulator [Candidatus Gastranaerophilales bacterium]